MENLGKPEKSKFGDELEEIVGFGRRFNRFVRRGA